MRVLIIYNRNVEAFIASQNVLSYTFNERRTTMNKLVQYDPFAQLSALQQQFFGDDWLSPFKGSNIPTTDVFTKDNELVVEAHLPNFTQDNVNIQVDNGDLIIQAQRHEKDEDKSKKYVVHESSSSFYRRFQLPERANADDIEANLEDGVLKIKIPMTPLPEPKKIAIKNRLAKKIAA
jgi:HSP20 family protein